MTTNKGEELLPEWIKRAAQRIANAGQMLPDTTVASIIAAEYNARRPTSSDYRRGVEDAARIAEAHNADHEHGGAYQNCGLAIAQDCRALLTK